MKIRKLYHWPTNGEIRWERRFAWLPTAVNNEVIWLKFYWVKLQYVRYYGDMRNVDDGYWSEYICTKQDIDF